MKCNHDCFNCVYEDCINDYVRKQTPYKDLTDEQKKKHRESVKRSYERAKAKGLCSYCRKRKATHGIMCYECYLYQKRYQKRRYNKREQWQYMGLCWVCGRKPMEGHKVCEIHYFVLRDGMAKARKKRMEMIKSQKPKGLYEMAVCKNGVIKEDEK